MNILHGAFNADGLTRLVMDEFSLHKGHQYAKVVMDEQRLRVLWVGKGRSRATLKSFFAEVAMRAGLGGKKLSRWVAQQK